MSLETKATELLEKVIEQLTSKIESGDATHQEVKNAIELLKDNGITVDVTIAGNAADTLAEAVPFEVLEGGRGG